MCAARVAVLGQQPGTASRTEKANDGTSQPTTAQHPAICLSNILPLDLDENPASGRGRYATVGVLEPAIRIERSGDPDGDTDIDNGSGDGSGSSSGGSTAGPVYRIVVTFALEVAIVGFDQGFQKYNRFFDAVSLRYLFCRGDQIDLRPRADAAVHGLQVTRERDKTSSIDAGISAGMVTATAPNFSVQVQRNFQLTYTQSMDSWRTGLSYGAYPKPTREPSPTLSSLLAAYVLPKSQQLLPATRENVSRFLPQDLQQPAFQVRSPHAPGCHCQKEEDKEVLGHSPSPRLYDRSALWSWQTQAALRLWTPEIYGAVHYPVTIMREVPVAVIDALPPDDEALRTYLHFDFEVDIQLRVLGWGSLANLLKRSSRPAELRAQSDTGQPLPRDHVRFSVACCPAAISWPLCPTRNLQEEAEVGVGKQLPRRLPTNAEFYAALQTKRAAMGGGHQKSRPTTGPSSQDEPLLPWPVAVPWPTVERTLVVSPPYPLWKTVRGQSCPCQALGPDQNRLYHCCVDCPAGHAYQSTRRRPTGGQGNDAGEMESE